jgi:hypothetical protein
MKLLEGQKCKYEDNIKTYLKHFTGRLDYTPVQDI